MNEENVTKQNQNQTQQQQQQNQTETTTTNNAKRIKSRNTIQNEDLPPGNSLMPRKHQIAYYKACATLKNIKKMQERGKYPKSLKKILNQKQMIARCRSIMGRYMGAREKKLKAIRKHLQAGVKSLKANEEDSGKQTTSDKIVGSDSLTLALVSDKGNGVYLPIGREWNAINFQLNKLLTSYLNESMDGDALPVYESKRGYRGFRIIYCKNKFSKDFLFKCLASIQKVWKNLNLKLIPESEIPKKPSSTLVILDPKQYKWVRGNLAHQTPPNYDATTKTTNTLQPEMFPSARPSMDFSMQNCSYSAENSGYQASLDYDERNMLQNFPKNPSYQQDFPSTSWQSRSYFNSVMEKDSSDQSPGHSNERNPEANYDDWQRSADSFAATQSFHDVQPRYSNSYGDRDDRLPAFSDTPERSIEINSRDWQRSFDFPDRNFSPSRHSIVYRSRDEALSRSSSRDRNSDSNWRKSPECFGNSLSSIAAQYHESPPPYCSSFSRADANYQINEQVPYRSADFYKVTPPQQSFGNFGNYLPEPDSFDPTMNDNEAPPPPPRWRDNGDNRREDSSRRRRSGRSRSPRRVNSRSRSPRRRGRNSRNRSRNWRR